VRCVALGALTSRQIYGPVVVAMTAMWMMETAVHNVVSVITVRYGFVSAVRAMDMT
jgi:hypothetical protein